MVVKTPVDSTTYSAPAFPHGIALGSRSEKTAILFPETYNTNIENQSYPYYIKVVKSGIAH